MGFRGLGVVVLVAVLAGCEGGPFDSEDEVASLTVWPADTIRIIAGREARLFVEVKDDAGRPLSHPVEILSSGPAVTVRDRVLGGAALGSATVTVRVGGRSVKRVVEVVTGESYSVRSLGAFVPGGINNLRWIAGAYDGQAALWRDGEVLSLPHAGLASSRASFVNDSGTVVGTGETADGAAVLWSWRAGVSRPIALPPGAGGSRWEVGISDLNNRDEIVVFAREQRFVGRLSSRLAAGGAVSWSAVPGDVRGINDRGVLVGGTNLYDGDRVVKIPVPARIPPNQGLMDVNNRGQYVGVYAGDFCEPGFHGEGTTVVDLSPVSGCFGLHAINDFGDLIGNRNGPASAGGGAVLVRSGKAHFLRPGGSNAVHASGLNDLGQVTVPSLFPAPLGFLLSPAS